MPSQTETNPTTQEVCRFAGIDPDSAAERLAPATYVQHLLETGRRPEAVRFLAQTLSPELAVRWALTCVHLFLSRDDRVTLPAVEAWLNSPVDAHRRAAKEEAERYGLDSPAATLAMAVFFSGGSISQPEAPHVPAPPGICQRLAAGAVILAVVSQPEQSEARFQKAVEQGRH